MNIQGIRVMKGYLLNLLNHWLEVLEKLNTPEEVARTGKYTSYWDDESTHNIIPIPKDTEGENIEIADQR